MLELVAAFLLIIVIVLGFFVIKGKNSNVDSKLLEFQKTFTDQMQSITSTVNESLNKNLQLMQQSQQYIGSNLNNSGKIMSELQQRLAAMEESNKKIFDVGKDISSLQEILKAPKMRGNLGELFLGELLEQIMPKDNFRLQYKFSNNERVDAVIVLGDKKVSVDSKFPLENFKRYVELEDETEKLQARKLFARDVKKHVDDIAMKYIVPDEGTFDFALMYIPAENIYYETIISDERFGEDKSIANYAINKKVIPVSPNSFYAYLQAILLGLKGLHIEKSAQKILESLGRMQGEFMKFREDFDKIGTHVANISSSYDRGAKRLDKFESKLENAQELSGTAPDDTVKVLETN